jgi:hypothetical protein
MKSRILNLLETSGPVKACNGIALHELLGFTRISKKCLMFVFFLAVIGGRIKRRKMRWAGHVARMGEDENFTHT